MAAPWLITAVRRLRGALRAAGPGEPAAEAADPAEADGGCHVRVGATFEPDRVQVQGGARARITFRRDGSSASRDAVVFPTLGRLVTLPPDEPVTVEFTELEAGEYGFSCADGTPTGTLVVLPAAEPGPVGEERSSGCSALPAGD